MTGAGVFVGPAAEGAGCGEDEGAVEVAPGGGKRPGGRAPSRRGQARRWAAAPVAAARAPCPRRSSLAGNKHPPSAGQCVPGYTARRCCAGCCSVVALLGNRAVPTTCPGPGGNFYSTSSGRAQFCCGRWVCAEEHLGRSTCVGVRRFCFRQQEPHQRAASSSAAKAYADVLFPISPDLLQFCFPSVPGQCRGGQREVLFPV